jgi:hypothetical protein
MPAEKPTTIRPLVDTFKVIENTVAAAATPETLTDEDVYAGSVVIKSLPSNTSYVSLSHDVSGPWFPADGAAISASEGKQLNLKEIFIQVNVDGEGVKALYHSTGREG